MVKTHLVNSGAQCKTYTRIGKGRVTQDNMIGGTANFTCDSNYALIGESTLTCQDNAKWDNSAPKCKKGNTSATFVSAGVSRFMIAFTDLRVCLGEFIDRDHAPVNPV